MGIVALCCVTACRTYQETTIASIEIGDEVRVTDMEGIQYLFEVTYVDSEAIVGDGVMIGIGEIASLEEAHRSLAPLGVGLVKGLLGVMYFFALTFPLWAPFLHWA